MACSASDTFSRRASHEEKFANAQERIQAYKRRLKLDIVGQYCLFEKCGESRNQFGRMSQTDWADCQS